MFLAKPKVYYKNLTVTFAKAKGFVETLTWHFVKLTGSLAKAKGFLAKLTWYLVKAKGFLETLTN